MEGNLFGISSSQINSVLAEDNLEVKTMTQDENQILDDVIEITTKSGENLCLKFCSKEDQNITQKINNEVNLLKYLAINSECPVPTVMSFSSNTTNPLGREYILTTVAEGTKLIDIWEEMKMSEKKEYVKEIVEFIEQLNLVTFPQIGSFAEFDENSGEMEIGEDLSTGSGPHDKFTNYLKDFITISAEKLKSSKKFSKLSGGLMALLKANIGKVKVEDTFNACHNDLKMWNIIVDPDTKKIVEVVGWGKASCNVCDYNVNSVDIYSQDDNGDEDSPDDEELEDCLYEAIDYEDCDEKDNLYDIQECLVNIEELPITKEDPKDIYEDIMDILLDSEIDPEEHQ